MSTVLLFFGYSLNYMMKIDMGIAVVCMTNHTAVSLLNNQKESMIREVANISSMSDPIDDSQCPITAATKKYHDGEFVWSEQSKGLILSAYFYGYIFLQVDFMMTIFRAAGKFISYKKEAIYLYSM